MNIKEADYVYLIWKNFNPATGWLSFFSQFIHPSIHPSLSLSFLALFPISPFSLYHYLSSPHNVIRLPLSHPVFLHPCLPLSLFFSSVSNLFLSSFFKSLPPLLSAYLLTSVFMRYKVCYPLARPGIHAVHDGSNFSNWWSEAKQKKSRSGHVFLLIKWMKLWQIEYKKRCLFAFVTFF